MEDDRLKTYDPSSLQQIKELGNGSYGNVQLIHHEALEFVVVKTVFLCESEKTIKS